MVANDQFHNFHGSNIKRQKKKLQLRGNCCAAFVHSYHTGVKIELYLGWKAETCCCRDYVPGAGSSVTRRRRGFDPRGQRAFLILQRRPSLEPFLYLGNISPAFLLAYFLLGVLYCCTATEAANKAIQIKARNAASTTVLVPSVRIMWENKGRVKKVKGAPFTTRLICLQQQRCMSSSVGHDVIASSIDFEWFRVIFCDFVVLFVLCDLVWFLSILWGFRVGLCDLVCFCFDFAGFRVISSDILWFCVIVPCFVWFCLISFDNLRISCSGMWLCVFWCDFSGIASDFEWYFVILCDCFMFCVILCDWFWYCEDFVWCCLILCISVPTYRHFEWFRVMFCGFVWFIFMFCMILCDHIVGISCDV